MNFNKIILYYLLFFTLQYVAASSNVTSKSIFTNENEIDSLLQQADKLQYENNGLCIQALNKAKELALKYKNKKKLADVYTAFGVCYYIKGSYDISFEMHLKAIKLHEQNKNYRGISKSLNGIGLVQMGLKQYEESAATFRKCIQYNTKLKKFDAVGRNYFNISLGEIEQGKYKEALKNLKITLRLSTENNDVTTEHMVYSRLGEVKLFLNDADSSLYYYQKLFSHPQEPTNWEKTYAYAGMAQTYLKKSDLEQAEKYGLASFNYARQINAKWDIERSTHILSEIYALKKDMSNAYKYLAINRIYNDSLYDEEKIREINYQQLKRKEAENLQLISQNEASLQKEKANKIINYSFFIFILFLLIVMFLMVRNIKLKDRFNKKLTGINKDIENQKALIASQNETLEGLNKSKNHLFSILSHDLKTPINSIIQVLELQQQGHLTTEVQEEIFKQLLKQVEGTSMMLNNLLHWANTQMDGTVVNFEKVNLNSVVEESASSFYLEAFNKKITINHKQNNKVNFIKADLGQVRIIIQNVLANAIKFTPLEGKVDIFYSDDLKYQKLHIVDFGLGMSQNIVDEIINFDKRMSSEMGTAMEKGTGLGLLLVKQFLINNQGKMSLKSEEGKGTEFIISFLKFS